MRIIIAVISYSNIKFFFKYFILCDLIKKRWQGGNKKAYSLASGWYTVQKVTNTDHTGSLQRPLGFGAAKA